VTPYISARVMFNTGKNMHASSLLRICAAEYTIIAPSSMSTFLFVQI